MGISDQFKDKAADLQNGKDGMEAAPLEAEDEETQPEDEQQDESDS
ncbi:hypothetical protein [Streptomyces sp. NPDC005244]